MAMNRIYCKKCGWTTRVHYSIIDCVKEKEFEHTFGIKEFGFDAHDSAFGYVCPKCGENPCKEEYRYFPDNEIQKYAKQAREI